MDGMWERVNERKRSEYFRETTSNHCSTETGVFRSKSLKSHRFLLSNLFGIVSDYLYLSENNVYLIFENLGNLLDWFVFRRLLSFSTLFKGEGPKLQEEGPKKKSGGGKQKGEIFSAKRGTR